MKALPITYTDARENYDEPFNNLTNGDILMEGAVDCEDESIIVCDSHYLNLDGMLIVYYIIIVLIN